MYECLQEVNDPYRGLAIWPSNCFDETTTPCLILDRGVEFWHTKIKIVEYMQRNHYLFKKIFNVSCKITASHWNPWILKLAVAIWPSNSLDETATPFLILDRALDFWNPKSRIFECMQRNRYCFRKLTSVYRKSRIPIEDWRSDRRILSTKLALNFASAIGRSIFEAPRKYYSNV